jgi:chemotaxis response regulator CheB
VSDCSGTARFATSYSSVAGKLNEAGDIEVAVTSLDDFIARGAAPAPDVVKIDVEGAELATLHGAANMLAKKRPVFFIDAHSTQLKDQCTQLLKEQGYGVRVDKGSPLSDFWNLLAEKA